LEKKCQGVEELDLAQNKLARWTEVREKWKEISGSDTSTKIHNKKEVLAIED
jgi:hypothetical protein